MAQQDSPGAALVRKRWEKTTPEERQKVNAALNRARKKKYTKEERSALARKAAEARWSKKSDS